MKTSIFALSVLFSFSAVLPASAIDLGNKSRSTPYDRFMKPVKQVLAEVSGEEDSMRRVQHLMRVGRGFRYSFDRPYTAMPPEITERTRRGDCKDKALWLISRLNDDSARFVIGKATEKSKISHAWVLWNNNGRWWILDCTNRRAPIPADRVRRGDYIPLYSYSKEGVYTHFGSNVRMAKTADAREPVASRGDRR